MFTLLKAYLARLLVELSKNGKMLVAYILAEWPGLTDYPGVVEALNKFAENPTTANAVNFLVQALLALGAGHRLFKILRAARKVF